MINTKSNRKIAYRLTRGQDLKLFLLNLNANCFNIKAGVILSAVGSLEKAVIRTASGKIKKINKSLEIVSITGTLSQDGNHIHISVADKRGKVYGGHLWEGCIIDTTCELILQVIDDMEFHREYDPNTGYDELVIQ